MDQEPTANVDVRSTYSRRRHVTKSLGDLGIFPALSGTCRIFRQKLLLLLDHGVYTMRPCFSFPPLQETGFSM